MFQIWVSLILVAADIIFCSAAFAAESLRKPDTMALSSGLLLFDAQHVGPFRVEIMAPEASLRGLQFRPPSNLIFQKLNCLEMRRFRPFNTKKTSPRDWAGVSRTKGLLQLGGIAVRRSRPGQLLRATEAKEGQDLQLRAGVKVRAGARIDVVSEILYIRPTAQSLFARSSRSPLQMGFGARISLPNISCLVSAGAGMAQLGEAPRPGIFVMLWSTSRAVP